MLEIHVLTRDRHKHLAGLKWIMESQPSPPDVCIEK